MNKSSKEWYVKSEEGSVYGPADVASLVTWTEDGRVGPTAFLSRDRRTWTLAMLITELAMEWLVELEPGRVVGPYNRTFLIRSFRDGALPATARFFRLHELPIEQDPPPVVVEKEVIKEVPVEKVVVKEVIREVPVEKIVEKVVVKEVPVEKIVEKIVEVEKPVPVVEAKIVDAVAAEPVAAEPPPLPGGIFKNVEREKLVALESAVRRELAAAAGKKSHFGFFGRK